MVSAIALVEKHPATAPPALDRGFRRLLAQRATATSGYDPSLLRGVSYKVEDSDADKPVRVVQPVPADEQRRQQRRRRLQYPLAASPAAAMSPSVQGLNASKAPTPASRRLRHGQVSIPSPAVSISDICVGGNFERYVHLNLAPRCSLIYVGFARRGPGGGEQLGGVECLGVGLAEAAELGLDALGGEERGRPGGGEELAEGVSGGEQAVDEEVVDEGAVDEHLARLTEAEAGGVELPCGAATTSSPSSRAGGGDGILISRHIALQRTPVL
ncbi:hypothetical protein ZWY2020_023852 [Hordeum vulgare]|nr:hypothetical protein ZWY2020_023852 [Hordeum vulgare]